MYGADMTSDNPFAIVSNLKKNPTVEASKNKITFELLFAILSNHTKGLNVTESEFMSLKSIKPVRFTLPLPGENRAEFINIVGGSLRKGG